MYWGKESNTNHSTISRSPQSQNQSLQREVETYTRKFEEEKRKLFRVQENHRETFRNYQNQLEQLEQLKARKYRTQIITLNAKIKNMEMDLEKGINSYNDSLSKNNSLKNQIDELRKHRKNQIETSRRLRLRIEEVTDQIKIAEEDIELRKEDLQKFKQSILEIKQFNEEQALGCRTGIDRMQKNVQTPNKMMKETMKNATNKSSTETFDSQPIVKLRLKNLLYKNKERIRVADQYKRSMEMIAKGFQEIKKQSGINSIEEITKIFLKHEEQNIFIYEHIDKLSNQLENLNEENQSLREKISEEENKNDDYRALLNGTPEDKKRQLQLNTFIKEKNEPIIKFNQFLKNVESSLNKTLGAQSYEQELNFYNYRQRFGEIEKLIDEKYLRQDKKIDESEYKENATKYSKGVPSINLEEVKQKNEESILEEEKLHEFAYEFWEKKKSNK